ncbi:hypothetical protein PC117_g16219 [Phytophthora cactorum]|uniref:Uncharacterized protein n=1 Tax=Phytophthora cactorum TaxID=29920 RepID=A0A8T1CCA5_9STRA|nr:hypothetical protein PC117_g16219 [Phytophthora cactorum]KAG4055054.1 hypothetical protein PC123_g9852 [Phytophthora cactorum]
MQLTLRRPPLHLHCRSPRRDPKARDADASFQGVMQVDDLEPYAAGAALRDVVAIAPVVVPDMLGY